MQTKSVSRLFYNGGRLQTELRTSSSRSLISGLAIPLIQQTRTLATEQPLLLATDMQSSVIETLGQESRRITYACYGNSTELATLNLMLGFTGQRWDADTQFYALGNGHRIFSSAHMRFLSPDTLSPFHQGGINAYAYCKGDPINRVDTSGQMPESSTKLFKKSNGGLLKMRENALSAIEANPALDRYKPLAESTTEERPLTLLKDSGVGLNIMEEAYTSNVAYVNELPAKKKAAYIKPNNDYDHMRILAKRLDTVEGLRIDQILYKLDKYEKELDAFLLSMDKPVAQSTPTISQAVSHLTESNAAIRN